ncbi:MAG TPA: DUF1818 family protein [Microcoleaceae cyanobacterium]|jgi:hypothetical protein
MARLVKSGSGWRIGYDAEAPKFQGLIGTDDWALELTAAELDDFCRLLNQLTVTIAQISHELMDEETIACEVESDLVWLEAEGYPQAYSLHVILLTGRGGEGRWTATVVPELLQAVQSLQVF